MCADASLLHDYPRYAHKYSQLANLLWKSSIGRHWPHMAKKSECTIIIVAAYLTPDNLNACVIQVHTRRAPHAVWNCSANVRMKKSGGTIITHLNTWQAGYLVWPPFKFPQSRQNVNTDLSMFIHKISSAIYLPLKLLASYFHILLSNLKTRNVKYIQ